MTTYSVIVGISNRNLLFSLSNGLHFSQKLTKKYTECALNVKNEGVGLKYKNQLLKPP